MSVHIANHKAKWQEITQKILHNLSYEDVIRKITTLKHGGEA